MLSLQQTRRRGVILLVVVALLTLFAVVGLSFVLYAEAAAQAARLRREAENAVRPDVEPELLLAYFLGQLLYDAPDDGAGLTSALRGHSLARSMYGGNGGQAPALSPSTANVLPYNGVGRLRGPSPFGTVIPGPPVPDDQLINYTYYPNDPDVSPGQRFLRDPERLGWRAADLNAPRGAFTGGCNAPYTYPDLNSTYLAAVRADGSVLLPSFHRPWAANVAGVPPGSGAFYDAATGQRNPFWEPGAAPPPWFKYTTLRPLPALNPGFPPPEDGGGDVKNLIGGPGTFRRLNGSLPEYWNNDSIWMDLGFPVLTAADGRRYKPLFAALVTDLDNRVNVNVHGNVQGPDAAHASNQGWGPWEVNPGWVLPGAGGREWHNLLRGTAVPAFLGRHGGQPWAGQFGVPGRPGAVLASDLLSHLYSQTDFDGRNEQSGSASGRLLLPGFGSAPASPFPSFLDAAGNFAGYGNLSAAERRNHPALFSPYRPAGDDRSFAVSNMEALLRYGDTGTPGQTSELLRLCPLSLADARARRLVTTHSADVDRPGVAPWLYDPSAFPYEAGPTLDPDQAAFPQGPAASFPALANRGPPPYDPRRVDGEFGAADWRAVSAGLARVDLNRALPPYPHQGSGTVPPFGPPLTVVNGKVALDMPFDSDAPDGPIWKQFIVAQAARQRLANEIYRRLLVVTGVPPIRPEQAPQSPPPYLLRTRRWLAQLAVNVVDYLDEDDISTPFFFYTAEDYKHLASPPSVPPDAGRVDPARAAEGTNGAIQWPLYWVFGTELPRIVVNEAMAQVKKNQPDDAYADTVRVFVELHNPLPRTVPAGTHAPDGFPIPLRVGNTTPYQVVIGTKSALALSAGGATVPPGDDHDNVLGNPDVAAVRSTTMPQDFQALSTVGGDPQPAWTGATVGATAYRGVPSPHMPAHGPDTPELPQGVVLLGPPASADAAFATYDPLEPANNAAIPQPTPLLQSPRLEYTRSFTVTPPGGPPDERAAGVSVLLRRLANPYLPFDGRRTASIGTGANFTYNPYVTIDYLEQIPLQPVEFGVSRPVASTGRPQPFAAHRSLLQAQTVQPNANVSYTFGRSNVPAAEHCDWLTHLDRPPISPTELAHVSGYAPHELTQRFQRRDESGQAIKFGHRAPWLDEGRAPGEPSSRLYRLFEFLEAGPRTDGLPAGGPIPGKINLNTVWDAETLQALFDPQPSNGFTNADINDAFSRLLYDPQSPSFSPVRRTQGLVPGPGDRPMWGQGVGTYPAGDAQFPSGGGTADTVLRFQPPAGDIHPYLDAERLTKVFNHLTTRSNVFAVWLTVGFFEVTDETTRPVKLGAEIGRTENRHVRHRMFAILDRTNLSIASCVATLDQTVLEPLPYPQPAPPQVIAVSALEGSNAMPVGPGVPWRVRQGSVLVVDVGDRQETVEVLSVNARTDPPTITAVFTKPHAVGTVLSLADVPGAPPVFLKPVALQGPGPSSQPPSVPQPPYPVTITLSVDPAQSNTTTLAGLYDGIPWRIVPAEKFLLDIGAEQEAITVQGPFTLNEAAATGTFRAVVTRPHAPNVVLTNTLLGNPGPQPGFRLHAPAVTGVVRYVSIIQ